MDDVHIAQFAAMLRTVSKGSGLFLLRDHASIRALPGLTRRAAGDQRQCLIGVGNSLQSKLWRSLVATENSPPNWGRSLGGKESSEAERYSRPRMIRPLARGSNCVASPSSELPVAVGFPKPVGQHRLIICSEKPRVAYHAPCKKPSLISQPGDGFLPRENLVKKRATIRRQRYEVATPYDA